MLSVFAVLDTKAAAYGPPMVFSNSFVAQRALADELKRPDSVMARHPEDYVLMLLGSYDELSGILEPESAPAHVVKLLDLVGVSAG
jgi:hypothetical protein